MACWGVPGDNRLNPLSSQQEGVDANTGFLALSSAISHNCGIRIDSTAACWGAPSNGRTDPTSAAGVDADTRFLAVGSGDLHSCGIKADGAVVCWGSPRNDLTNPASSPQGIDVANTRFLSLSVGDSHSCGIKENRTVACWGGARSGRIDPTGAAGVNANTGFLTVSSGNDHSCGIKTDRAAACWGNPDNGRTDPASGRRGVDAFLAVSAGHSHSCGIKADGRVACWGSNNAGQANPPSDSFNQTPDVFRLAERNTTLRAQDGGEPVRLNEVTEVEPLRSPLALREGETTTLTLISVSSGPATPIIVTLAIEEPDSRFLSVSPELLIISEAGGAATATITAIDNKDVADIDPINITLSLIGDNARLTSH